MLFCMSLFGSTEPIKSSMVSTTAICKNIAVQLDASGQVTISPSDVDAGSTSCSGPPILSLNLSTFTCTHIGVVPIQLTVMDANGGSDICIAQVTVSDVTAPVVAAKDTTLYLDANGQISLTATELDAGSSDACGINALSLSKSTFNCSDIGMNAVTLTAMDANGNAGSTVANVTVLDTIPPTAICNPGTLVLNPIGNGTLFLSIVNNGSNDACGIKDLSLDKTSFDCNDLGPQTVTLTVTDNNDNSSQCTTVITVEDNTPPIAECRDTVLALDNNGNASITAAELDDGSRDACSLDTLTLNMTDFTCGETGINIVTFVATDSEGNTDICTSIVEVIDVTDPVVACKNISVNLNPSGMVTILPADVDNGSTDECGIATLSLSQTTFDCTNIGANVVDLIATDNNGNSASCQATVTVNDVDAPSAMCQNITAQLDATGQITLNPIDVDNGSIDSCSIASMSLNVSQFTCINLGINPVTLTVTDQGGNTASCTAMVTITNNFSPTASCNNLTVYLDANGDVAINPIDIDPISANSCEFQSMTLDQTNFDCNDLGPQVVTLTVNDVNLNQTTCTSLVSIQDTIPPMASCKDITVDLDPTGNANISASDIDNGSFDACGITNMTISENSFNCAEIGQNIVELIVTDVSGNSSSCLSLVTVRDTLEPVAICQNTSVFVDVNGNASVDPLVIGTSSTDDCGIQSLTLDQTDFTCMDIGINAVTLTATDFSGNSSTCQATVNVMENVIPVASCKNIVRSLDTNGQVNITAQDVDGFFRFM